MPVRLLTTLVGAWLLVPTTASATGPRHADAIREDLKYHGEPRTRAAIGTQPFTLR